MTCEIEDHELTLMEHQLRKVVTARSNRTLALRHGREFLSAASADTNIDQAVRDQLKAILEAYPTPAEVRQWIESDLNVLPEPAMTAINDLSILLFCTLDLHRTAGATLVARGSIAFHHPLPDEYQKSRRLNPAWTVRDWLQPEGQFKNFRLSQLPAA